MKYGYIRKQHYQQIEFQDYFSWIFYHFTVPTVKIKKVEINKLNRTTSFMIHIFDFLREGKYFWILIIYVLWQQNLKMRSKYFLQVL